MKELYTLEGGVAFDDFRCSIHYVIGYSLKMGTKQWGSIFQLTLLNGSHLGEL